MVKIKKAASELELYDRFDNVNRVECEIFNDLEILMEDLYNTRPPNRIRYRCQLHLDSPATALRQAGRLIDVRNDYDIDFVSIINGSIDLGNNMLTAWFNNTNTRCEITDAPDGGLWLECSEKNPLD